MNSQILWMYWSNFWKVCCHQVISVHINLSLAFQTSDEILSVHLLFGSIFPMGNHQYVSEFTFSQLSIIIIHCYDYMSSFGIVQYFFIITLEFFYFYPRLLWGVHCIYIDIYYCSPHASTMCLYFHVFQEDRFRMLTTLEAPRSNWELSNYELFLLINNWYLLSFDKIYLK